MKTNQMEDETADLTPAIDLEAQRLWTEYTAAATRAQRSQDIHDGIVAGDAWATWLHRFEGPRSDA